MNRRRLALVLVALCACVANDPDAQPPIAPWPEPQRAWIEVAEMKNDAPSPEGAAITVEATAMLRTLLARSERFRVASPRGPAPTLRLATTLIEFHDADAHDTIVFEKAQSYGRKRRAVVEIHYRLEGAGEPVARVARGAVERADEKALPLPEATGLATGAFWHTEFGRAARECLDAIVRDACLRLGPAEAAGRPGA